MKNKMFVQEGKRWSIRRLTVGVASVAVASFIFLFTGTSNEALAAQENSSQSVEMMTEVQPKEEASENNKTAPEKMEMSAMKSEGIPTEEVKSAVESNNEDKAVKTEVATQEEVKKSVVEKINETTEVPAGYLENAKVPGPFLAGVNGVIPYEFFGGDGMLTRLLLKASIGQPWSDNGEAKNPALLPLEGLGKGQYFYQVALDGNVAGKEGQALLDQLKMNGSHTYKANVLVYGSKDGKPDLMNVVSNREVSVMLNGLKKKEEVNKAVQNGINFETNVPSAYLENAKVPGPFLAGVNGVIPYEFFGGDGMLTRLLLKASMGQPWSDNGEAKNPALLPLENLGKGQYFYQVALDGNVAGKEGQALLDQLKMNGTHTYKANVLVYGSKDGKPDLMNVVAKSQVLVNINADMKQMKKDNKTADNMQMMNKKDNKTADNMQMVNKKDNNTADNMQMMHNKDNMMATKEMNKTPMTNKMMSKDKLPNTGLETSLLSAFAGLVVLAIATVLGFFGIKRRRN